MRSFLCLALALAACSKPAATPTSPPTGSATATDPGGATLGTSGAGIDFGANEAAVRAAFPGVTPTEGGLWENRAVFGRPAITKYVIGPNGLDRVDTEWTDGFASMEECGKTWKVLRAKLDERFGASQSDNLAAYWKTKTASLTLACNPNDNGNGSGVLSLDYSRPSAD